MRKINNLHRIQGGAAAGNDGSWNPTLVGAAAGLVITAGVVIWFG